MDSSIEKQIKEIEDEIFKTQKNKATEHHIGKLKAKIARLRDESEKRKSRQTKGKGFSLKKTGDATLGIVGFPSIGKSTLLNQLTDASSKVGDYDFTTLQAIPGMMKYLGAEFQLLDLPGLILGASQGRGRGREILSAIRNVDLLLIMLDPWHIDQLDIIIKELSSAGLRLNQQPPDVVVTKKGHGGITINATVSLTNIDELMIKSIASEFVINADITIRENITEDRLIDSFAQNRVYVPALLIINKIDLIDPVSLHHIVDRLRKNNWVIIPISAKNADGLQLLKQQIFTSLKLIRVYMKPVGKKPDFDEPLILRKGETVEHVCKRIHRDIKRNFRYATVTGASAKHVNQKVGLDHVLQDQDILTLVIKK